MGKYQFHAQFEFPLCRVLKNRAIIAVNAGKSMQKASEDTGKKTE